MDGKMLIRLLAVIFVAFAITAAAIDMARRNEPRSSRPSVPVAVDAPDPHRQALARCQELGEAAGADAGCLALWAENRRRFLGQNEGR
jgi:conjugative transfer region protein TrbK